MQEQLITVFGASPALMLLQVRDIYMKKNIYIYMKMYKSKERASNHEQVS